VHRFDLIVAEGDVVEHLGSHLSGKLGPVAGRRPDTADTGGLAGTGLPELLDWAEEYRGARGPAADAVGRLLATGGAWLHERVRERVAADDAFVRRELAAFDTLRDCRRALVQHNANPQMVAERALLALREAVAP